MKHIIIALLLATTLHAQQGGWGRDKSSLSTSGDITAGGAITAGQGAAFNGSGPTRIGDALLQYPIGETNIFWGTQSVGGATTNGEAASLWSQLLNEGYAMEISAKVGAFGDGTNYADRLEYTFTRSAGGSPAISITNHVNDLTNTWFGISGNNIHCYTAAELNHVMNTRVLIHWTQYPLGQASWGPTTYFDCEETGAPSGWTYSTTIPDWDYATNPLEGSQSWYYADVDGQMNYTVPVGVDESWLAFSTRVSANPAAAQWLVSVTAPSTESYVQIHTDRTVRVYQTSASFSGYTSAAITTSTSGKSYVKCRYKKGTGANAELEVWVTNDLNAGWGTGVIRSGGTQTGQLVQWMLRCDQDGNFNVWFDEITYSTSDIPTSWFQ